MSVAREVETANEKYAASFTKGDLPLPPARKVAIVACMDAGLDPARALGLEEGDAHITRNAGGRVSDALRSIVISQQLLGTREIIIVHHTDCGMLTFTDDDIRFLKGSELVLDVPVTGFIYEVESGKIVEVE
ncbi:hypothetical protein N7488_009697 [Penicillium malachiteum]|nr:hypothetical protein N7488_009697 [Penicillium malachiteum]